MDSVIVYSDDMAARLPSLPFDVRPPVLGNGVSVGHVYNQYVSVVTGIEVAVLGRDSARHDRRCPDGLGRCNGWFSPSPGSLVPTGRENEMTITRSLLVE
ncbi:hypothetical protein D3C73_1369920 [compost metagenome]